MIYNDQLYSGAHLRDEEHLEHSALHGYQSVLGGDPFYNDIGEVRSGNRYEQECLPEFGQAVFCRKGVGSGDAVERGCGWEEEMREELRRDWWEGWGSGWLDTSGCYTHRTMGRMCACYSDKCNRGEILGSRKHLLWLVV